mmetsp:Transcript_98868/g.262550  ORF Transcript_98868/g.262550 Transcript_98868/m.262550 type:complete len:238 (-) Transcript_98868:268-981(-)
MAVQLPDCPLGKTRNVALDGAQRGSVFITTATVVLGVCEFSTKMCLCKAHWRQTAGRLTVNGRVSGEAVHLALQACLLALQLLDASFEMGDVHGSACLVLDLREARSVLLKGLQDPPQAGGVALGHRLRSGRGQERLVLLGAELLLEMARPGAHRLLPVHHAPLHLFFHAIDVPSHGNQLEQHPAHAALYVRPLTLSYTRSAVLLLKAAVQPSDLLLHAAPFQFSLSTKLGNHGSKP